MPTVKKAYATLIEKYVHASQPHLRQVLSHLRKEYADFLRMGLDLEQEM